MNTTTPKLPLWQVLACGAAIVTLSIGNDASSPLRYGIAAVALTIVVAAVAYSKSKDLAIGGDADPDAAIATAHHPEQIH